MGNDVSTTKYATPPLLSVREYLEKNNPEFLNSVNITKELIGSGIDLIDGRISVSDSIVEASALAIVYNIINQRKKSRKMGGFGSSQILTVPQFVVSADEYVVAGQLAPITPIISAIAALGNGGKLPNNAPTASELAPLITEDFLRELLTTFNFETEKTELDEIFAIRDVGVQQLEFDDTMGMDRAAEGMEQTLKFDLTVAAMAESFAANTTAALLAERSP